MNDVPRPATLYEDILHTNEIIKLLGVFAHRLVPFSYYNVQKKVQNMEKMTTAHDTSRIAH